MSDLLQAISVIFRPVLISTCGCEAQMGNLAPGLAGAVITSES